MENIKEQILDMIHENEENGNITVWEKNDVYHVTVEDFEGFNNEWQEIDNNNLDEEAIEEMIERLTVNALTIKDGYNKTYYFDGFTVTVGYSSNDI